MKTKTYYTTRGSVRGECGHKHRDISTAYDCFARDQRGCERQGGYSDRTVCAVKDGEERELTDGEQEYVWALEGGDL